MRKIILALSAFLVSCESSGIGSFIAKQGSDGRVTCDEYKAIYDKVFSDNRESRGLRDKTGNLDDSKLKEYIRSKVQLKSGELVFDICNKQSSKIVMYIENSGSMLGYINRSSEFQNTVVDVYSSFNHDSEVRVNLINSELVEKGSISANELGNIITHSDKFLNKGSSDSDLNRILETVLDKTSEETVSILFSDFIYSLDNNQQLSFIGRITKDIFLRKANTLKNLSVLFVQLESTFNGDYYTMTDTPISLQNVNRPYYMMVIGDSYAVADFSKTLDYRKLKGHKNSYFMSSVKYDVYPKILLATEMKGRLRVDKNDPMKIELMGNNNSSIQFAIALDLSKYPEQRKLLEESSYDVSEGYKVAKVIRINPDNNPRTISNNDWQYIKNSNYTHCLVIQSVGQGLKDEVFISLKNIQPKWVSQTSTNNDIQIKNQLDKTLGLSDLIDGITDAFSEINAGNDSFFTLKYNIKK